MTPLVSIIVPAYNQEQWIAQTLDSVLAQTYQQWECIVMDDGSGDRTVEIARDYARRDGRFRVYSQENGGPSRARNQAILFSEGTYILPLDADDTVSPLYLEVAMKRFSDHPETKLVYCKADLIGALSGPWNLRPYAYDGFIRVNCIFNACIFRRSDYDRAGGYDESMRSGLEDWDFLIGMLQKDDVVYQIPKVMFHYRIRDDSHTSIARTHEPELFLAIMAKHPDVYKDLAFHELREKALNPDWRLEQRIGHVLLKPKRLFRALLDSFRKDR